MQAMSQSAKLLKERLGRQLTHTRQQKSPNSAGNLIVHRESKDKTSGKGKTITH